MAGATRLICPSARLADGGTGVRFAVHRAGRDVPAFVIRFAGAVRAYLNECGHIPAELDWMPGEFFDQSRLYLVCSMHGALYAPDTGACLGGPCRGAGLTPLKIREAGKYIILEQDDA